jgi:GNAT superfamily N-acetyltransferase
MFNKGTQYFTVKYNGRIIAQSVIVDSINNKKNESVVVLDNIEVANNYKNKLALLSKVYKTFWAEYTSKEVKIGTGHLDLAPDGAKLEPNNYSPKYSLSYSDANGSNIFNLPKIQGLESLDKVVTYANITERDIKLIEEMEKEIYPDGMVLGKGQVQEVLDASRTFGEFGIPGSATSFIIRQGNEPAGYMLWRPDNSKINPSEQVPYIQDFAVMPKFQNSTIARKMMERILENANIYNVPAIEMHCREGTSYRTMIHPRVQKWIEGKGYKIAYNEPVPEYTMGGENFYFLRLEKIQNQE